MRGSFAHGLLFRAGGVLLAAAFLLGATECTYRGKTRGGGSPDQFTQGTVTRFGSVFAAGVEYTTSGTTITVDGASATEADLRPGYVVALKGRRTSGSATGSANSISADAALVGEVTARDASAGTVVVLGTTVQLGADTSYGAGVDGAAATPFAIGDRLVVHGFSAANTGILATRVERVTSSRALQAAGRIAGLDANARRYVVRGTTIDYSAATADGTPAVGAYAFATGTTTNADGSVRATRVQVRLEAPAPSDKDTGDVEGVVSRFGSATDFDVAGRTVTTTSSTTYVNGAASDLKASAVVTVSGTFDSSGKLAASRVEFRRTANFRMLAPIESFNTSASTFLAGGVQVQTNARTRWEDRTAAALRTLYYADLRSGDWIEARGVEETASRTATALVVERRAPPANGRVELQGVAASLADPTLVITGVTVRVPDTAEFRDRAGALLGRATFFSQARNQPVVARGLFSGGTLVAESLQLRP
jgi:hypothetical protein